MTFYQIKKKTTTEYTFFKCTWGIHHILLCTTVMSWNYPTSHSLFIYNLYNMFPPLLCIMWGCKVVLVVKNAGDTRE